MKVLIKIIKGIIYFTLCVLALIFTVLSPVCWKIGEKVFELAEQIDLFDK